MGEFPDKLHVPLDVLEQRAERQKEMLVSASWGVFLRSIIILFELVGVWLYGSSALLFDAFASLIDVASSLLLIFFIKLASRPPDHKYPFGHGRYEPLIGLQLGLLLLFTGGGLLFQQIFLLFGEIPNQAIIYGHAWIFPVIAVVLLEICYYIVMYTARRQNSPALEADALHYRVDSLTSLFAAVALIFAALVPSWGHWADHLGALAIAVFMLILGLIASRKNLHQLVDRVPEPAFFDRVATAAKKVEGIKGTEKIGIQLYGPDAHVDIDVEVDPLLSVEVAHEISQRVRLEIQKDWPAVRDVIVHIEPYYPNDH